MRVLKPKAFAVADLVSSNATEVYAAWNIATTYAKDAYVDYGTHIYQSLVNSNTGHQPDISPLQWVFIGPDNTHAMFDEQVSTQTISTTPLDVVVKIGYSNSAAFLNLAGATTLEVDIRDGAGGTLVYSYTEDLDVTIIYDWYMYFFEPFAYKDSVILEDLPQYLNAHLYMTLSGTSGTNVAIGELIYGTMYTLGSTEHGATAGIIDYSRKETDEFGTTTFVRRAYSKRMTGRFILDNLELGKVQKILADLRATPAVYIAAEDEFTYSPLVVYGFYRDFSIDVAYPTKSYCSIEIEGLL